MNDLELLRICLKNSKYFKLYTDAELSLTDECMMFILGKERNPVSEGFKWRYKVKDFTIDKLNSSLDRRFKFSGFSEHDKSVALLLKNELKTFLRERKLKSIL